MKIQKLLMVSLLVGGISTTPTQAHNVQSNIEEIVLNCLNGPLRGFPDHTIGCLTQRTTLLDRDEKVYLDTRGLRGLIQKVNGQHRLVITKKPIEKPAPQEATTIPRGNIPTTAPYVRNSSVKPTNPTPYIIHGAGEISVNGQKVYKSP